MIVTCPNCRKTLKAPDSAAGKRIRCAGCLDMPCDVVFHASEWKAVCMVRTRTEAPDVPPSLNDMICWIAAMGGHVIRSTTKAKHPGTQTLWLGLPRVNDLAIAWNSYGPGKITTTQKSLIPQKKMCGTMRAHATPLAGLISGRVEYKCGFFSEFSGS